MSAVTLELGVKNAKFATGLTAARNKVETFKKGVTRSFNSAAGAVGLSLGVGALIAGVDSLTAKYDRLAKLAKQFGSLNTDFFQRAAFVAEQSGTDVEALAKGMDKLLLSTRYAEEGSALYVDALKDLGFEAKAFADLNQEQQFLAIADAVKESTDKDRTKAAVLQLMGKRATELIPLLNEGAAGFEQISKNVRVLSKEDLANMEEFRDMLNEIKTAVTTLAAAQLPPIFRDLKILFGAASDVDFNVGDSAGEKVEKIGDFFAAIQRRRREDADAKALSGSRGLALAADLNDADLPAAVRARLTKDLGALVNGGNISAEADNAFVDRITAARQFTAQSAAPAAALSAGFSGAAANIPSEVFQAMLVELREIADKDPVTIATTDDFDATGF